MQKPFYQLLYQKPGKKTWEQDSDNRRQTVKEAAKRLAGQPTHCLDLGCGSGLNTRWLANLAGNHWTGVDFISAEDMNLKIPAAGRFIHEPVESFLASTHEHFNLIVDQGSVLVSLENDADRERYMNAIALHLLSGGLFVVLTLRSLTEKEGHQTFPDGRVRVFLNTEQLRTLGAANNLKLVQEQTIEVTPGAASNPIQQTFAAWHGIFKKD